MTTSTVTQTVDLQKLIKNAQLSALPQSAIQILELSKDPNHGPNDYARPIEGDPGLAGQVLRFVNSSYFGFSREIASVKLAINLVGVRTIKNFTLWSAVFSLMPNPQCGPFDLKCLWLDSLRRALFARKIANMLGQKDAEDAFMAALLQDMAVPVLAKEAPAAYKAMLEERLSGGVRLSELEQEQLGWTHGDAGAELALSWRLPQGLSELIRLHAHTAQMLANPQSTPAQKGVCFSALLPASVDAGWAELPVLEGCYQRLIPGAKPSLVETLKEIDELFLGFAPVFKISKPSRSLEQCYQECSAAAT